MVHSKSERENEGGARVKMGGFRESEEGGERERR